MAVHLASDSSDDPDNATLSVGGSQASVPRRPRGRPVGWKRAKVDGDLDDDAASCHHPQTVYLVRSIQHILKKNT